MRLRREILKSYYDHVPFVINSGYAHHAAFLARQAPTIRRRRTVAKTDSCGCPPLSGWPLQNRSQAMKKERRLPITKKYTRPMALCVGADPNRAALCEIQP